MEHLSERERLLLDMCIGIGRDNAALPIDTLSPLRTSDALDLLRALNAARAEAARLKEHLGAIRDDKHENALTIFDAYDIAEDALGPKP